MLAEDHPVARTELRFFMLGSFRIQSGAQSIQLTTRKTESLLAYLVLNPGSHAREKLAALFWGDKPQTEARNSLRNALAVLNKNLSHDLLLADRQLVGIDPDYPIWVDVLEFEAQAQTYLSSQHPGVDQVDTNLYKDHLLVEHYDDWITLPREHYFSLFLDTLLNMAQQMRSLGEYHRAAEFARQVISFDAANERAHQHLMFCCMAQGDRTAALRQFEECKRLLWEELAVEPSPATVALHKWIKGASAEVKPFEAQITNLPIPITSFVGRKREMAGVKSLLSSRRLVTLTGPGGSGKTRLAIQSGTDLLDVFEDGVWWVDLGVLRNPTFVLMAVAKALGVSGVPGQPLEATLENYLATKNLLLVLDNCEHLIEACAHLVESLLARCPGVKILATSREPLNLIGETVSQVPTLTVPDLQQLSMVGLIMQFEGIQLFVERARDARSGFALTEQNAPSISQICNRLDGIPLAIELAAARVRLLSVDQINSRLDDRFRLLTSGSRTALSRHQTLSAAIEWSCNLLTDEEKLLFLRLAVFAGGWTLEACEEVCAGGELEEHQILELLTNLVDKSLVISEQAVGDGSRFRMLETIRQYAREALIQSEDAHRIQAQHLNYFHDLVRSVNPHLGFFLPDEELLIWSGVLERDLENLRAALSFSLQEKGSPQVGLRMASLLHWFWLLNSHFSEGRDWLEMALAPKESVSTFDLALAKVGLGFLACWQGDFQSAYGSLDSSLELFTRIGDKHGAAFSLHGLGFAANGLGDHAQAGARFGECLEIAREIEDGWLLAFALHFIAISSSFGGDLSTARDQFIECIALIEGGSGNIQGVAFSRFHLARIALLQGDFKETRNQLDQAIRIFWQMSDRRGLGYSLAGFGWLALAQGDEIRAARLFGVVDSLREELGTLLESVLQVEYDQARSGTKSGLGAEAFTAEWSRGKEMTLEQAFQFAIDEK